MKDLTRREVITTSMGLGMVACLPVNMLPAIDKVQVVQLSQYKEYQPYWRAHHHLRDIGFTDDEIRDISWAGKILDAVISSTGIKGADAEKAQGALKALQVKFKEQSKNIIWMRDDGTELNRTEMWMLFIFTLARKNMDCIAFMNNEEFDKVFPEPV